MELFQTTTGSLNRKHYDKLISSGLTPDSITKLLYRSVNAEEAYKLTGHSLSGMLMPYLDIYGEPVRYGPNNRIYYRLRPDEPFVDQTGKLTKYLSPSRSGCHLYFSPLIKNWDKVIGSTKPLVIIEGEFKADAACQLGIPTIGLAGINNWRRRIEEFEIGYVPGEEKSRPLEILEEISWKHRPLLVAVDSDWRDNDNVKYAAIKLIRYLEDQKARPYFLHLPSLPNPNPNPLVWGDIVPLKQGLDDFLFRYGREVTLNLIRECFKSPATEVTAKGDTKVCIDDVSLNVHVAALGPVMRETLAYNPALQQWYEWSGKYWEKTHNNTWESLYIDLANINGIERHAGRFNATIGKALQFACTVPAPMWDASSVIVFNNGTLKNGVFRPTHERYDFITSTPFPYDFDPDAKCPQWLSFLDFVTEGNSLTIMFIRCWMKWVLLPMPDAPATIEKVLDLCGGKGTGKSTLLEIFQALVGPGNVGTFTPEAFSNDKELAAMRNKRICVNLDATGKIDNPGTMNSVISNEVLTIKEIYKKGYTARLNTRLLRGYNTFPRVKADAEGLDRRLSILLVNRRPTKQDPKLKSKLLAEIPGIFQWAWKVPESTVMAFLMNDNAVPAVFAGNRKRFESQNPVFKFLVEKYGPNSDVDNEPKVTSITRIYDQFKVWAEANNGSYMPNRLEFPLLLERFGCDVLDNVNVLVPVFTPASVATQLSPTDPDIDLESLILHDKLDFGGEEYVPLPNQAKVDYNGIKDTAPSLSDVITLFKYGH